MAADDLTQAVIKANEQFYAAMAAANLRAMTEIWHHGPATECIHPGWERIRGWPKIRASWAKIFQHQGSLPVQAADLLVHQTGSMAWVTCNELITVQAGSNLQISQMLATNVFERVDGIWRMIIHHASPAPPTVIKPRTWQASLN